MDKLTTPYERMIMSITGCGILIGMIFLWGTPGRSSERVYLEKHYPLCSPVAHEVQRAWQEGEISEAEAHQIIQTCLAWEDEQ